MKSPHHCCRCPPGCIGAGGTFPPDPNAMQLEEMGALGLTDTSRCDFDGTTDCDGDPCGSGWVAFRNALREPFAEFLGVAILVIFGNGVNCQVVLSSDTRVSASSNGSWLSIKVGWAVGAAMGGWVSAGISGGHINPAITLALATCRRFPWRKVPAYITAQILGGIAGAAVIYGNYIHPINIVEGGPHLRTGATAGLFATYAAPYMTDVSCFFSELLGTAILMTMVLAINDKGNSPPSPGHAPLAIFLLVLGIGTSVGMETGYAINPARDLGPRILTAMVGYGRSVFTFRRHYWLWCPILGPVIGAQLAVILYDCFLYTGRDSVFCRLNTPQASRR